MTWLCVVLGGALGAPLRYLIDAAVSSRHDGPFPWGTWVVNVSGSFVLGVVVGAVGGQPWLGPLIGTGVAGALTTFSTFSLETLQLARDGGSAAAMVNVVGSVVSAYAAAALGIACAGVLL